MNPILENGFSYLLASDFDQTLSFNDSGYVLCDLLGIRGFEQKVAGLAKSNLVHQGAELAYLLRHDPEFRVVRREHLREVGKRVRLKDDLDVFVRVLSEPLPAPFPLRLVKSFNPR
jgi:hypothetical protein